TVHCELFAARLGSPLDARLEVLDPAGKRIAENDDTFSADPFVRFTAKADGVYQVRVMDTRADGGQAFVYRLTLTSEPYVDGVCPLGGRRGSKVALHLMGQGLPDGTQELLLPSDNSSETVYALETGGKRSNAIRLELDELPEFTAALAEPVTPPAVFNGRIAHPGAVNTWAWTGKKGEVFDFDLRAGRLGSPLDGVLTIHDAAGKELARAEAGPGQLDPALIWTVTADGKFTVRVQERLKSRGGPAFAYRLRVAPPVPDFRLWLASDAVTV